MPKFRTLHLLPSVVSNLGLLGLVLTAEDKRYEVYYVERCITLPMSIQRHMVQHMVECKAQIAEMPQEMVDHLSAFILVGSDPTGGTYQLAGSLVFDTSPYGMTSVDGKLFPDTNVSGGLSILSVYIRPRHRKLGLGAELVLFAMNTAKRSQIEQVCAHCNETHLHDWYTKLGFDERIPCSNGILHSHRYPL